MARGPSLTSDALPHAARSRSALAVTLRHLREERSESREVVAVRAGLTVASLAHIELAQANPARSTVKAIAHALDPSMVELAEAVES